MAKICIVSPSLKLGGIERQLVLLAKYFVSQNHDVYFIICLKHDKFYTLDKNVKLIEPNFIRKKSKLDKLIFYPKILFFIRRSIKAITPDTVLTFGDGLNSRVILSSLGLKIPIYISDRTSVTFKLGWIKNLMKKLLYPLSSGLISQTQFAAEFKRKQFKDGLKVKVIPNILDFKNECNTERENIILFSGRLSIEKGPDLLLKAFSKIHMKCEGWKLYFAGSGPLQEEMRALSESLNLSGEVIFLGNVENIFDFYCKSKIFVLPSRHEGYPNSLIEAMASSLACVCFDSFPAHEIIENNSNGVIIERENIDFLASAIIRLVSNENERLIFGKEAIKIKLRLSPEIIGKQYEDFILGK